MYRLH